MPGKILLINRGSALMVNRLASLLEVAGIGTYVVEPLPEDIERLKYDADAIVLLAGSFIYNAKTLLEYLRDVCLATGKPLYAAGSDNELTALKADLPKELIKREFIRPFDINELSTELQSVFNAGINSKTKKSVLLVDDDVTFLQMMQSLLGAKYRVTAVSSGREALEYLLTDHKADLVLLDYDMPDMTGPQVLETLRHNPKISQTPVMFLTGKSDRKSVINVVNLKPDGYILKSSGRDDILASLFKFFKTHRM